MAESVEELINNLFKRQREQDDYVTAPEGGTVFQSNTQDGYDRDNIQDLLTDQIRSGVKPTEIPLLPESTLYDDYSRQLRDWRNISGLRPGSEQIEHKNMERYVLRELSPPRRARHPGISFLYDIMQPAFSDNPTAKAFTHDFTATFPIKGDPLRYGLDSNLWPSARFNELMTQSYSLLYLINEQTPSDKERREAFGDILSDWRNAYFVNRGQAVVNEQFIPLVSTDAETTFDQYQRWLNHGGLTRPDGSIISKPTPSNLKYDTPVRPTTPDPDAESFLRPEEVQGFHDAKGFDLFRYAYRKMPTYVARRRTEQLERVPVGRGNKHPTIQLGLTHDDPDEMSTITDVPDFSLRDLTHASPFARWAVRAGQAFTTEAARRLAYSRSDEFFHLGREMLGPISSLEERWRLGKEQADKLAPPIMSEWLGGSGVQIGLGLASTGSPVGIGVFSAMMLGLVDRVKDVSKFGLRQFGHGLNAIRHLWGEDEIPIKDIESIPLYLGRWFKSMAGYPNQQIKSAKQQYDYLAQHFGIDDPAEMARVMDEFLPASLYVHHVLTRASEWKLPTIGGATPGPIDLAFRAAQFPLENEAFKDTLSHMIGEPIDDTSVAALYLGLGPAANRIARITGLERWPTGITTPLDRVSMPELLDRDILMSRVVSKLGEVKNPLAARNILSAATDEALLHGPLDPPFAAKIRAATQHVVDSEAQFGDAALSPAAKQAMTDLAPDILNIDPEGPTSAWFVATNELPRVSVGESARFADKTMRLLRSIESGHYTPPLEGGAYLKGSTSVGRALNFTQLKGSVKALLDEANYRTEVQGKYVGAREILKFALNAAEEEATLHKDIPGRKREIIEGLVSGQKDQILDAVNRLERFETEGGTVTRAHPDLGTPLYNKIQALRQAGTFRGLGIPGNSYSEMTDAEIFRIGGQPLLDEIQRFPGLKEALIKSAAGDWLNRVHAGVDHTVPLRPEGPRPEFYQNIRNIVRDSPAGHLTELPPEAWSALNSTYDQPFTFNDIRAQITQLYKEQVESVRRLRYLSGDDGIIAQLRATLDTLYTWRDRVKGTPARALKRREVTRDLTQRQTMERVGQPREDLDYTLGSSGQFAPPGPPPSRAGFRPNISQELPFETEFSRTPDGDIPDSVARRGGISDSLDTYLRVLLDFGTEKAPVKKPFFPTTEKPSSVLDEVFTGLENRFPGKKAYKILRETAQRIEGSSNLLEAPETLIAHARKIGLSPQETEQLLLRKGGQKLGFLDQLMMWDMAQKQSTGSLGGAVKNWLGLNRYRNALIWNLRAAHREGVAFENSARFKAQRLFRAWNRVYTPEEMMHLMDTLRTGKVNVSVSPFTNKDEIPTLTFGEARDKLAVAQWQRFLFHLTGDALKAGRISEQDFADFYGRDGYYRGVYDSEKFAQASAGFSPYPIPGRFRTLEVHPSEFSFAKPEDSFYVTWRKGDRGKLQYREGFKSYEAAFDWLNSDFAKEKIQDGTQVSINSPWKIPAKLAAGMLYEPTISVANLARSMGINNAHAFLGHALRDSAFVMSPIEAASRLGVGPPEAATAPKSKEPRGWSIDSDGMYWIKMNDDSVPHLKGYYVNEHAIQWLNMHHPNMRWIHELLREWQEQTGIKTPDLPDIRNPLVPRTERLWNWLVGRHPAITATATGAGKVLGVMGNALTFSKVLLSLPSLSKQWISNYIFNIPAMTGMTPGSPLLFADILRYGTDGLKAFTYAKKPEQDWAVDALFRNENIEMTGGAFYRAYHRVHERNWLGLEGVTRRYENARQALTDFNNKSPWDAALGDAKLRKHLARQGAELAAHVELLEKQMAEAEPKFWRDIGRTTVKGLKNTLGATFDAAIRGRGPLTDGLFYYFGLPDQLSKYISLRHLVERRGLSVEEALSRIDAYGQNLHRVPEAIKGLSQHLGGTKFTAYPYQQAANMLNIARNQPVWALSNLAMLYAYNRGTRAFRGDNEEEDREFYGRSNYGGRSNLTDLLYDLGRMELPNGGHLELDGLWGIFNGFSPVARSAQDMVRAGNLSPTNTALADAATGLLSHFAGGSVPLSAFASWVSKRDPYGEPIKNPEDSMRAIFKLLTPDLMPPYGRDYMFLTEGPEVDPKTNKPRTQPDYWARRFAQYHPPWEMESPARLKAAMDSVLKADGATGRFYGDLAYYDLLEVKARARGGPIKPDGTVDQEALEKLVEQHYMTEGVQRSFKGLGDDEEPDPKDRKFILRMAQDVQQPRLMRSWRHLNAAQQFETYALYRAVFDHEPDAAFDETFRLAFTRELLGRQMTTTMKSRMLNRYRYWEEHQASLPDGVFDTLRGWMGIAMRRKTP